MSVVCLVFGGPGGGFDGFLVSSLSSGLPVPNFQVGCKPPEGSPDPRPGPPKPPPELTRGLPTQGSVRTPNKRR